MGTVTDGHRDESIFFAIGVARECGSAISSLVATSWAPYPTIPRGIGLVDSAELWIYLLQISQYFIGAAVMRLC